MAVAIRGTTPATSIVQGTNPHSVTLTGTRQPQAGDVLIIVATNDFYLLSNINIPTVGGSTSGVTAISGGTADGGSTGGHLKSWYYVVGSTGDLTVQETETGTTDEEKVLAVWVLSGADISTVIDGSAATSVNTTPSGSQAAPSVSPTSSDAFLISVVSTYLSSGSTGGGSYTPPSGMTEDFDLQNLFMQASGAHQQLATSGATGARTFTCTVTTQDWVAISIPVLTAAAGGPQVDPYPPTQYFPPGWIAPNGLWEPLPATLDFPASASPVAEQPLAAGTAYDAVVAMGANAEAPASGGTAFDAGGSIGVAAEQPTGAGTAGDAAASLGANAEAPTAVGTAYDATVSTSGTTNAPAESPAAAGSALDAVVAVGANAEQPGATGTAFDAPTALGVNAETPTGTGTALDGTATTGANAGLPSGTGAAQDAQAAVAVNAEAPTGTGTAYDATVSTSSATNAPAEAPSSTGTAYDATVALGVPAGAATGAGSAGDALAGAGVNADIAAGTGTAQDAAISLGVGAEAPAATGQAFDATVSTAVATNAPAESPSAAGTAYDASVAITFTAGLATAAGTAPDAGPSVGALPATATAVGTAWPAASIAVTVNAETAPATGQAYGATASYDATIIAVGSPVVTGDRSPATVTGDRLRAGVTGDRVPAGVA